MPSSRFWRTVSVGNHKLRARADAQDHYDRQRQADRVALDEAHRQEILRLATDFPAVWHDPRTPARERKRMAALLVEDVTVRRGDQVTLHVRFRGGTATTLTVPRPLTAWERRRTSPEVLTTIDALLAEHTDAEVAALLNAQGLTTGPARCSPAIASSGSAPPRGCRVFVTACARPTY